ncbi:GGDEF domain-containing protein [Aliiroseovarius sp. PrR006]|uniref:GGDEF domain-containing protein n=1 Tax=Aliiroseovarius sp. PrR006 TaxID=2706883 RepID=UPI0013D23C4A|nr:GGDEF domain-containing protein [Aliiroseovarius sp. PrR006]NDW52545.1 GGDEF domain-containing protein [Aliiroseovarius sp. PrR006]
MNIERPIPFTCGALDHVLPMHMIIDGSGVVLHAGPTIQKVFNNRRVIGRNVFGLLELRRPRSIARIEDVAKIDTRRVQLKIRDPYRTSLTGALTVMPDMDSVLLNLSFGYSISEAVARYELTGSDFAPTDLAVEMLYLVEAKSAVMDIASQLAHRLQDEKEVAQTQALTDGLTGLANRRALETRLERQFLRRVPFSLMHLDLDFFKSVNDTHGHAAGDAVLEAVAQILREETREEDLVARVGGDEFVIVLDNQVYPSRLEKISARLIRRIEAPITFQDRECRVSASIGVVPSTNYVKPDLTVMAEDADRALYASKHAGRSAFTIAERPGKEREFSD